MSTPGAFDAWVIDQQDEREAVAAYGEYRQEMKERGLKPLDFTAWQERMEAA
jgi:hypothetical protein